MVGCVSCCVDVVSVDNIANLAHGGRITFLSPVSSTLCVCGGCLPVV